MVYFTGDIHGYPGDLKRSLRKLQPERSDVIILLGDVGANFYGDERDHRIKKFLNKSGPTFFCIHGNHEMRPETVPGYTVQEWNGGHVWVEPKYPHIIFAKDGEIYNIDGLRYLVIGGAYSVDKFYRLARGMGWWPDEQPSESIKSYVEQQISEKKFDIILSHTCPLKYEPIEMFIPGIDQSKVDTTTEEWLDRIEESVDYLAWFCGHWHTNKRIDKMHFLFHDFETDEQFQNNKG